MPAPVGVGTTWTPGYYAYPGYWGYGYYGYYGGLAGMGLFDYLGGYGGFGYGGFGGFGGFDYGYSGLGSLSYGPGYASAYGTYDPYAPSAPSSPGFVSSGSDSTGVFVSHSREAGALRLKVKPDIASVYLDGEYVGLVNQYDGIFHKLHLDGGNHRVEIQARGYRTLTFNVRIEPDHTETYRGELEKDVR
jgi:hypothetical protein